MLSSHLATRFDYATSSIAIINHSTTDSPTRRPVDNARRTFWERKEAGGRMFLPKESDGIFAFQRNSLYNLIDNRRQTP
jgi:hypothetical protein